MSQTDLAARSGLSTKHINQIIQGLAPLTQETALILERVTGTPAGFWNRLEASFRESELRAQQHDLTTEDDQWLSTMPVRALQATGHLPTQADRSTLFHSLLAFFGVADRAAWDRIWMRPLHHSNARKPFAVIRVLSPPGSDLENSLFEISQLLTSTPERSVRLCKKFVS